MSTPYRAASGAAQKQKHSNALARRAEIPAANRPLGTTVRTASAACISGRRGRAVGACDPFLVHWRNGIKARGEIRNQYAHIIDMVPTVLDALGVEPPATVRGVTQSPLHGISFAHTFDDPAATTRHRTRYFEMFGHRSIDHDGWRAVCPWPGPSFAEAGKPFGAPITAETLTDLDAHHWELYHVAEDPALVLGEHSMQPPEPSCG